MRCPEQPFGSRSPQRAGAGSQNGLRCFSPHCPGRFPSPLQALMKVAGEGLCCHLTGINRKLRRGGSDAVGRGFAVPLPDPSPGCEVPLHPRCVHGGCVARPLSCEQPSELLLLGSFGCPGAQRCPSNQLAGEPGIPGISCLAEQSVGAGSPTYRTTCHVAFPEVPFRFLNYLIDEPFLFLHPR